MCEFSSSEVTGLTYVCNFFVVTHSGFPSFPSISFLTKNLKFDKYASDFSISENVLPGKLRNLSRNNGTHPVVNSTFALSSTETPDGNFPE